MKAFRAWGLVATGFLLPAAAMGQLAQVHRPLAGVHSRGVQVLAPGQAAASDAMTAPVVPVSLATPPPSKPVFVVVPVSHPVIRACDRPFPKTDVTLGERRFDHRLADALKSGAPVLVDVADPYDPAGEAPSALSPWLSAAKAGGGAVTVTPYCTAGRGVIQDWVQDVVGRVSGHIYRPARHYDVVLYTDAARRRVTQVQFKPRPSAVAAS